MVMDEATARDRLEEGQWHLAEKRPAWDRRQGYLEGRQDLPYAPHGVNEEYLELRTQAITNWLDIAMGAPLQRLRCDGFRKGTAGEPDQATWDDVWQPNSMDSRQVPVYLDQIVHGRGLMGVWEDPTNAKTPRIRPESGRNVHLEADPGDPWTQEWAVKSVERALAPKRRASSALWLPGSADVMAAPSSRELSWVYDEDSWWSFSREVYPASGMGDGRRTEWTAVVEDGRHDNGAVPFVPFDNRSNSTGTPRSDLAPLIPAQNALNTIRFQTLLAMQFSAYRQRIISGFDPVARDADGKVIYRTNSDGSRIVDGNGMPVPVLMSPGRPGVDRLLVFPGDATKVFDLPESNLDNYITVLGEFLTQLFAVGQVPPQYLLSRMSNLSGDALTAAESTLNAKVKGLQTTAGESLEAVMRMANRLRSGGDAADLGTEVIWAEAEVRTFGQVVDAISKLITTGMEPTDAWAFLPDATPPKLKAWGEHAEARRLKELDAAGVKEPLPLPSGPTPADGRPGTEDDEAQPAEFLG